MRLSVQIVLIVCLIRSVREQQLASPIIYLLNELDYEVSMSNQNRTYVFEKSLFSFGQMRVIVELSMKNEISSQNYIIFGMRRKRAISYDVHSDKYIGDQIDSRGYYMQKQLYRIEFFSEYSSTGDAVYLTVFQKVPEVIVFSLRLIILPKESLYPCPFGCLGHGTCIQSICECDPNYFDLDCSKLSIHLLSPQIALSFENKKGKAKFYHISLHELVDWNHVNRNRRNLGNILSGIEDMQVRDINEFRYDDQTQSDVIYDTNMFMSIQSVVMNGSINPNQSNISLEVYYALEKREIRGVADRGFAKMSKQIENDRQTINSSEVHFLIDSFTNKDLLENITLLFGFRYQNNNDIAIPDTDNYLIHLYLKEQLTVQELSQAPSLLEAVICILAILILLAMLCLKGNSYIYQTRIIQPPQPSNKWIYQGIQEFQEIFNLIETIHLKEAGNHPFWVKYKEELPDNENPTCSICLCEFEQDDVLKLTMCLHLFHIECLRLWLTKQMNCPHCRNPFSKEILSNHQQRSIIPPSKIIAKISARDNSQRENIYIRNLQDNPLSPKKIVSCQSSQNINGQSNYGFNQALQCSIIHSNQIGRTTESSALDNSISVDQYFQLQESQDIIINQDNQFRNRLIGDEKDQISEFSFSVQEEPLK